MPHCSHLVMGGGGGGGGGGVALINAYVIALVVFKALYSLPHKESFNFMVSFAYKP